MQNGMSNIQICNIDDRQQFIQMNQQGAPENKFDEYQQYKCINNQPQQKFIEKQATNLGQREFNKKEASLKKQAQFSKSISHSSSCSIPAAKSANVDAKPNIPVDDYELSNFLANIEMASESKKKTLPKKPKEPKKVEQPQQTQEYLQARQREMNKKLSDLKQSIRNYDRQFLQEQNALKQYRSQINSLNEELTNLSAQAIIIQKNEKDQQIIDLRLKGINLRINQTKSLSQRNQKMKQRKQDNLSQIESKIEKLTIQKSKTEIHLQQIKNRLQKMMNKGL